jgi:two-component system, NarL family, sensor kinase
MLQPLNIGNKLALIMITFTLLVTAFLSASIYLQFENALKERVFLQLSSVKQLKMVKIEAELNEKREFFNQLEKHDTLQHEFFHIAFYDQIPENIQGYRLKNITLSETTSIIGVSAQQPYKGITLVFIRKLNDRILIAMARFPELQEVLLERTGLGETGESYLVNDDYKLISVSRFSNSVPKNILVKTKGVIQAFNGDPGTDTFLDYRGIRVLGAFEKIRVNDLEWVLLSEINYDEAMAPLAQLRSNLVFTLIIILLFILIVSYYLSRLVVQPVVAMEKRLSSLAKGILTPDEHIPERDDEIGLMFQALDKLVQALNETVIFAGKIGEGNFEADYQLLSPEDKLGEALIAMKKQLQEYEKNELLLLQENQRSILNGEEKERSRLSKELHDGLGPVLTTLRMNLQRTDLEGSLKNKLLKQIDETIQGVRRMSNNLMPSVLEDFGAGEAIHNLIKQVNTSSKIVIHYKNDMKPTSQIDKTLQIDLYRITQEAINNALKHSKCKEMKISISEFDEHIGLYIFDNGQGFNTESRSDGNGLRNMRERVKLEKGIFEIASNKEGTTIEIEIPKI